MTEPKRFLTSKLIKLGGAAALMVAIFALAMSVGANWSKEKPVSPLSAAFPELVTYGVGYGAAMVLTGAAFALVHWRWAPPPTALAIVFGLALVQIIVHFRCFLHVTLRGPSRDDLQLILFSTLIVLLMVGGTLVVVFNLRTRMM
jgi:cytochrome o ubiquinol oxidase operon protein cyoD